MLCSLRRCAAAVRHDVRRALLPAAVVGRAPTTSSELTTQMAAYGHSGWRNVCNAKADEIPLEADGLPSSIGRPPRRPKRRWLGVAELVTEFEAALASGERLRTHEATYENLQDEAKRLRLANDRIVSEVTCLNADREKFVQMEDEITHKLEQDGDYALHGSTKIDLLKKIRQVDYEVAGLRSQQVQNIKDIGLLKRTMHRIEKMGEVNWLVDKIEAALEEGEPVPVDGPEATSLAELVARFRQDYDNITEVVLTHRGDITAVLATISGAHQDLRELAGAVICEDSQAKRDELIADLQHMKRMLLQLSRLRDLQILNAKEIALMERVQAKLRQHAEIRELIQSGDKTNILAEYTRLHKIMEAMRVDARELESTQASHTENSSKILLELREMSNVVTPETGKLRERLVAAIQEEELTRERLAVLRSKLAQNIQFCATLKAALVAD